jgi:shikimate kinase
MASYCLLNSLLQISMHLSLIGMSGSGKSYWSTELAELGYLRFCCDELIADKLAAELNRSDGTAVDLGEWMGFPYEPPYKERAYKYLACEIEVIGEILDYLSGSNPDERVVVDTTGSVIYTGKDMLERLKSNSTVVHLTTPPEVKQRMLRVYLGQPRPVLWREVFSKKRGETNEEALARCYPLLLFSRQRLYEQYADVTIDYYVRHRKGFGVKDFLGEIQTQIRAHIA